MFNVVKADPATVQELIDHQDEGGAAATRLLLLTMDDPLTAAADLKTMRHDLKAALRTFKYIAQKVAAQYDPNDPQDAKKIAAINDHVSRMTQIIDGPISKILSFI